MKSFALGLVSSNRGEGKSEMAYSVKAGVKSIKFILLYIYEALISYDLEATTFYR